MQLIKKYRDRLLYLIVVLTLLLITLVGQRASTNDDIIYGALIYIFGMFLFSPIALGETMYVPYSNTELVKGRDTVLRSVFSIIFLFIAVIGLSFIS